MDTFAKYPSEHYLLYVFVQGYGSKVFLSCTAVTRGTIRNSTTYGANLMNSCRENLGLLITFRGAGKHFVQLGLDFVP